MARPVPRLRKGSFIRPDGAGGYRSIVAVGGPTFTSIANAASATRTFTLAEPAVLDKLVIMAGAAISLVAGADAAERGSYVTAITLSGDALVSGYVPANMFSERSLSSPRFGHSVVPGASTLAVGLLTETGATVEYGAGFTVA